MNMELSKISGELATILTNGATAVTNWLVGDLLNNASRNEALDKKDVKALEEHDNGPSGQVSRIGRTSIRCVWRYCNRL
jgi:hypothetical protein